MQGLGELEAAVMDVLWRAEEPRSVRFTSVRDVTSALLSGAEAGTGVERTHVAAVSDLTSEEALRQARRAADHICAQAEPGGGVVVWRSTHYFGKGLVGRDVSSGTAGIVLALAKLVGEFEEPAHADVLRRGASALAELPPLAGDRPSGLYVGDAGVAAALLRAGQVLDDTGFIDAAIRKGHSAADRPSTLLTSSTAPRDGSSCSSCSGTRQETRRPSIVRSGWVMSYSTCGRANRARRAGGYQPDTPTSAEKLPRIRTRGGGHSRHPARPLRRDERTTICRCCARRNLVDRSPGRTDSQRRQRARLAAGGERAAAPAVLVSRRHGNRAAPPARCSHVPLSREGIAVERANLDPRGGLRTHTAPATHPRRRRPPRVYRTPHPAQDPSELALGRPDQHRTRRPGGP